MAQRGTKSDIKRFAYAPESGGVRGSASGWVKPGAFQNLSKNLSTESLEDQRQLTSRKAKFASHIGEKTAEISLSFMLNENIVSDYDDFFECALGTKAANTALAINSGGTNSATVGAISSGVPDPIVKVTYNTGAPDYLPVKTYTGSVITWGIQSNIGARTAASYKNAAQCTGACYYETPGADIISLAAEVDADQEPGSLGWSVQGLVPSSLALNYDLAGRCGFDATLTGVDWAQGSVSNTGSPTNTPTSFFLGWNWDVSIQSLSSPAALTKQPVVAVSGVELAPEWIPNTYAAGRTSTGTVPGSSKNGWKRGVSFNAPIQITLDTQAASWITDRFSKTAFSLFLTGYDGAPSSSSARAVCIWFPEVVLTAQPEPTDINGIEGVQLSFQVQESSLTTLQHKCSVAFFNS